MDSSRLFTIHRVTGDKVEKLNDAVAVEEPLEIWIRSRTPEGRVESVPLLTTMRTPGHDLELVTGWLHTSAMIPMSDVDSIRHTGSDNLKGSTTNRVLINLHPGARLPDWVKTQRQYSNSSCGVCGVESIDHLLEKLPQSPELPSIDLAFQGVGRLIEQLNKRQKLFDKTGGTHAVAMFTRQGEIVDIKEDVGRHNALDKLIGANLTVLSRDCGLVLSGRVSFEMVQKAAMAGLGAIVAIGAPTSLAIELCRECDIALVGFAKNMGCNVYHPISESERDA